MYEQTPADKSKARSGGRRLYQVLKLLLALGLIGYLFYSGRISANPFGPVRGGSGLGLIALAGVLVLTAYFISSFRLFFLFRGRGLEIPWGLCLSSTLTGFFFNNFLPTSMGGDTVKALYLTRGRRGERAVIVGTMVFDRVLGLTGLAGLALLAQLGFRTGVLGLSWEGRTAWGLTGLALAVILGLVFLRLAGSGAPRRLAGRFMERFPRAAPLHRLLSQMADHGQDLGSTLAGLGISLVHHLCSGTALYLIHLALGGREGPLAVMGLAYQVVLAGILPLTPGSLGWTEYVGSLVWATQAMAGGGDIWVVFRVVTVAASLAGAITYFRFKTKDRIHEG